MVLEKIFEIFSYISTCKNSFPYCGPTRPLGAMILTNLLLHYIRKVPCKFQLFWPSSSLEEKKNLKWPQPIFTFLWLSPLWRLPSPLFDKIQFPSPKDNLYQAIEFDLLVLEKILKIFSVYIYSFAIIFPWRRANPFIWTNLNPPRYNMCQVWLKLAQWFWRRSRTCKSL
jgi:hypothetical protein